MLMHSVYNWSFELLPWKQSLKIQDFKNYLDFFADFMTLKVNIK